MDRRDTRRTDGAGMEGELEEKKMARRFMAKGIKVKINSEDVKQSSIKRFVKSLYLVIFVFLSHVA